MNTEKMYEHDLGFGQVIDDPIKRCPEREAIVFENWRITYGEFGKLVNQTEHYFQSVGLVKGDAISVISRNCPEYLIIEFAALRLGLVVVKINWRLSPEEMKYMLDTNKVKCIFLRPEKPEWGDQLKEWYKDEVIDMNSGSGVSFIYDLVGNFPADPIQVKIDPDDDAVHMHTSGTTGRPKCVVYTHGSMLGEFESVRDMFEYTDGQRYQFIAQLFHTACIGAYLSISTGGTLVLMKNFVAETYMKSLVDEHITAISVVPTVLKWILDEMETGKYDLSNLRVIRYSTCPISRSLLDRAVTMLNCHYFQSYGMTEMGSIITVLTPEDHFSDDEAHLNSVGKPIPGAEVKIMRPDGTECAVNEIGEICAKGPGRMKCYLNAPELTEKAFTNGWYHTKDNGFIDEYGYVNICGRADDMIISGGENIYPAEITNVLMQLHDDISELAVYGVPDETWGERVKASIVLMPGSKLTADDIKKYCRARMAAFRVPKEIEFLPELPKTATGKVCIPELKKRSAQK